MQGLGARLGTGECEWKCSSRLAFEKPYLVFHHALALTYAALEREVMYAEFACDPDLSEVRFEVAQFEASLCAAWESREGAVQQHGIDDIYCLSRYSGCCLIFVPVAPAGDVVFVCLFAAVAVFD